MKPIHQTAVILAGLTLPHVALAHPGHHDALTPQAMVEHVWTSPFHVLPLVLAALVIAGILLGLRRANRRSTVGQGSTGVTPSEKASIQPSDDTGKNGGR